MTNRYSPYYDRDEDRTIMSIDAAGSWVHITTHDALAARLDAAREKLSQILAAQSQREKRIAEAKKLLSDRCLLIVPDEEWQDKRDQFIEAADREAPVT